MIATVLGQLFYTTGIKAGPAEEITSHINPFFRSSNICNALGQIIFVMPLVRRWSSVHTAPQWSVSFGKL